jgi:hypothetical protein
MSVVRHHNGKTVHAHKMIVATARAMAGEMYDQVMTQNNELYKKWKALCPELTPETNFKMFVDLMYPHLIHDARAILIGLLSTDITQSLKDEIFDAIVKDNPLHIGRERANGNRVLLDANTAKLLPTGQMVQK